MCDRSFEATWAHVFQPTYKQQHTLWLIRWAQKGNIFRGGIGAASALVNVKNEEPRRQIGQKREHGRTKEEELILITTDSTSQGGHDVSANTENNFLAKVDLFTQAPTSKMRL